MNKSLNHTQMTYMKPCYRRIILRSGAVGAQNLNAITNANRLTAVWTTILFVNKFAAYFKDLFAVTMLWDEILRQEYLSARPNYCGLPLMDSHKIDTELVSNVIANLKRSKAIDFDGLSAEQLQYSHPSLCVVLSKLFQLMMLCSIVPEGFKRSYIVPIAKPKEVYSKFSKIFFQHWAYGHKPVLEKTFEHCILDRFTSFFSTSPNQFGFKKGIGCSHAIRSVRNIVDSFIQGGNTVTLCAIDLSKAC